MNLKYLNSSRIVKSDFFVVVKSNYGKNRKLFMNYEHDVNVNILQLNLLKILKTSGKKVENKQI